MEKVGPYSINTIPRNTLGRGSFGFVFQANHEETGEVVAAKCIEPMQNFTVEHITNEIKIMQEVSNHINILSILSCHEQRLPTRTIFWIITDLCSLGNLYDYAKNFKLATDHIVHIMEQVSSGLAYLHGLNPPVYHRDIKPDNVLFMLIKHRHIAKIADFGVSKIIEDFEIYATKIGTRHYMGPEYFDDSTVLRYEMIRNSDAFSAGVMFHEMLEAEPGKGLVRKSHDDCIGKQMQERRQNYEVSDSDEDSDVIKDLKCLIRSMTKFRHDQRKRMAEVVDELKALTAKLGPPHVPPASNGAAANSVNHVNPTTVLLKPPPHMTSPPSVSHLGSCKLPFPDDGFLAFSNEGAVIEGIHESKLAKMRIHEEQRASTGAVQPHPSSSTTTVRYCVDWKKERPAEMPTVSEKVLLLGGEIISKLTKATVTCIFDSDLQLLRTVDRMEAGEHLVAELPPDRLIYHKKGILSIYRASDHQHLRDLEAHIGGNGISACRHATSRWFAISCNAGYTLDIYTTVSKHHCRVLLPFKPMPINALASVGDYIIIAKDRSIKFYIYNWNGVRVSKLKTSSFGLSDIVSGVGSAGKDRLQLATGYPVNMLHLFLLKRPQMRASYFGCSHGSNTPSVFHNITLMNNK